MCNIRIKNRLFPKRYRVKELPQFKDINDKSQWFDLIVINDKDGVLREIVPLLEGIGGNMIYRGVNNASFRLFSTVQRQWYWNGFDAYFADLAEYIKYQVDRVRKDKYLMKNINSDNDYNILAMIQHYWGNSNLIDFSYTAKQAMFFAWDGHLKYFPQDGSLNDYVSLYMIDRSHNILSGPIEVNKYGAKALEELVSSSGLLPEQINAKDALTDLVKMPYDKAYDGKIVHGGLRSITNISVPFFNFIGNSQISNANLAAQDGCFIQGSSDAVPLEICLAEQHRYVSPLIRCYDIHKSLIQELCEKCGVPMNRDMLYPHFKAMTKVYNRVKKLDRYVPLMWMLGRMKQ